MSFVVFIFLPSTKSEVYTFEVVNQSSGYDVCRRAVLCIVMAVTSIDVVHVSNLMCHCGRDKNNEKNHLTGKEVHNYPAHDPAFTCCKV
jgi:hypothetical protein